MKPGTLWIAGICSILGVTVVGNIVVMAIANDDPSFAIETDYYKKAVDFDSTLRLERGSVALGWTAAATVVQDSTAPIAQLVVSISGKDQRPVVGLLVDVDALFNARANDVVHARLTEQTPGVYTAPLAVAHSGQWEVRIKATRPDTGRALTTFVSSARIDVSVALVSMQASPSRSP
ncbi:MAG: FixH family protein [Gemmatimonas sp.]